MNLENSFILLFIIAMMVAIGVRYLRLPYTVGLVIAGLILGTVRLFPAPELDKSLLFAVFLPGLIFEAAFHMEFEELWRNRITLSLLAVPGVIASTVLIAVILTPLGQVIDSLHGFTWHSALVFGALISATDPVAVISVFRRLGIPARLSLLVEGESLLNDGTGIVFFTLSLSIFAGTAIDGGHLALEFVSVVGMGLLIGLAIGVVISAILRYIDDPMIEVSLTTIAAYGSFFTAEHLGYSGIIATVAAGMFCGTYGARRGMSPSTRVAAETFWEYVAFALNSIVFLLIGIEVPLHNLAASWLPIIVAYLIVTLARALLIHLSWRLVGWTRERFPFSWGLVLTWGGLRGALPMVLALGLPADFPVREEIVSTTFGVVILSILGQGLTMSPLLRRLGIVDADDGDESYNLLRGRLQTAAAAIEEIERLERLRSVAPEAIARLKVHYGQRIDKTHAEIGKLPTEHQHWHRGDLRQARRHLLLIEKNRVVEGYQRGLMNVMTYDRLLADIDAQLLHLESGGDLDLEEPEEGAEAPLQPQV
ncbi:MAG TPA: Na+/H+ antiporter [Stellaceae bacterium]|nr:Na+/H+ antiporter [Stellaceae bacterium]